jgi:DNA-binding NarL/FixJ family response regulator
MRTLRILWVEDDNHFPDSVIFKIEEELTTLEVQIEENRCLKNGNGVWEEVRDWQPHIIMMDHNLEDVKKNGASLIIEIRYHNHDTPIIFYSSEMGPNLIELVKGENKVFPSGRDDVGAEMIRLISSMLPR